MAFGRKNKSSAIKGNSYANSTQPAKHTLLSHILRLLQFLSAFTSLILFSVRIAKVIRLYGKASRSNGAVEGILAAAVLYTIVATLLQIGIKTIRSNLLRILLIIMDILFVAAFIVVAVLTSPRRHGSSAPCKSSHTLTQENAGRVNCNLPWGTFILAIVSTILHAATAAYHAYKDRRHARTNEHEHVVSKEGVHHGDGLGGHSGNGV